MMSWKDRVTLSCLMLCATVGAAHGSPVVERERDVVASGRTLSVLADAGLESAKVWVYFVDKGTTDLAVLNSRLRGVARTLEPHATHRRVKALGVECVDLFDLPVDTGYVTSVRDLGVQVLRESRWLNAVSVRGSLESLRAVASLDCVARLDPVRQAHSERRSPERPRAGKPLDSAAGDPFGYGDARGQLDEIGVIDAHASGLSGAGVRIAFLDTGYWRDHPTFAPILADGRIVAQWDFVHDDGETQDEPGDSEGQHFHGTSVWSVAAGFDDGAFVGVAHGAEFLLAKTEDTSQEVPAEEDNWVAAAEWADQMGADVLSSSLSYIQWYTYDDMDGATAPTSIAAGVAASRGIVVCIAAGNQGTNDWFYIGAPADANDILTVGASQPDGSVWLQSSHGPTADGRTKPEVLARGASTYAAQIPGGHGGPDLYRYFDGTSMACPLAAGCAALVLEAHPGWSAAMVRDALMATADNASTPDNDRGWGRLDVWAAIGATTAVEPVDAPIVSRPRLTFSPNPFRSHVWISTVDPTVARGARIEIVSPLGRRVRVIEGDLRNGTDWDGTDARGRSLPRGVYLVTLIDGERQVSGKLMLDR